MYCGGDDAKAPSDSGAPDSTVRDASTMSDAGHLGDGGRVVDGGHRDGAAQGGLVGDAGPPPTGGGLFDGPLEPDVDSGDSVLRHHKNYNRDGLYIEPALTKAAVTGTAGDGGSTDGSLPGLHQDPNFSAILPDPNDHVYAQPLFVDGLGGQDMVIVATEANNIYALDATTGAQLWVRNVGTPVPLADKPCGNIDPFGVTGTPVIDFPSRTVFFDAEVLPSGADGGDAGALPKHEIFALSIDTGGVKAGWPVDVGVVAKSGGNGFNSPFQGQRGALSVLGGTLYVPYGGLFGDCQPTDSGPPPLYPDPDFSPYRGWVVGVSISDPSVVNSWATPACAGGAWVPGGVSSDGTSLYVSTGNTDPSCTAQGTVWGGGEAVLRFAAGGAIGAPADYFAPTNWPTLDDEDLEFGTAPIVFDLPNSTPGQLAIAFGKDGNAYLLDRTHLGGVGSALGADAASVYGPYATQHAAVTPIITAPALYTTAVATYVTFFGNGAFCVGAGGGTIATLTITPGTPPTLAGAWCATGGNGAPMVTTSDGHADAIVWQLGAEGDNRLHAFDGDTGAALAFPGSNVSIPNMRHFNSPIAAKGRILVAADGAVVAFTP
jgi:outer membrane protein assembly factor BamB